MKLGDFNTSFLIISSNINVFSDKFFHFPSRRCYNYRLKLEILFPCLLTNKHPSKQTKYFQLLVFLAFWTHSVSFESGHVCPFVRLSCNARFSYFSLDFFAFWHQTKGYRWKKLMKPYFWKKKMLGPSLGERDQRGPRMSFFAICSLKIHQNFLLLRMVKRDCI